MKINVDVLEQMGKKCQAESDACDKAAEYAIQSEKSMTGFKGKLGAGELTDTIDKIVFERVNAQYVRNTYTICEARLLILRDTCNEANLQVMDILNGLYNLDNVNEAMYSGTNLYYAMHYGHMPKEWAVLQQAKDNGATAADLWSIAQGYGIPEEDFNKWGFNQATSNVVENNVFGGYTDSVGYLNEYGINIAGDYSYTDGGGVVVGRQADGSLVLRCYSDSPYNYGAKGNNQKEGYTFYVSEETDTKINAGISRAISMLPDNYTEEEKEMFATVLPSLIYAKGFYESGFKDASEGYFGLSSVKSWGEDNAGKLNYSHWGSGEGQDLYEQLHYEINSGTANFEDCVAMASIMLMNQCHANGGETLKDELRRGIQGYTGQTVDGEHANLWRSYLVTADDVYFQTHGTHMIDLSEERAWLTSNNEDSYCTYNPNAAFDAVKTFTANL